MTLAPLRADAEGALMAWAASHPTLTGRGHPLAAGLHVHEVRSPAEGAVGYLEVLDRGADEDADRPRVAFEIRSKVRGVAETGARALAAELDGIVRDGPVVTTSRGERVKLWAAGDITGPTYAGDFSGEHGYRLDATLALAPLP